MKAEMYAKDLKRLIAATQKFIDTDPCKPIHMYIRLEFSKEFSTVTAIGVNGYQMSVEHSVCGNVDEDFIAYIKPGLPKFHKNSAATIAVKDKVCFIGIDGCYTGYKQPEGDFLDWKNVLNPLIEKEPVYRIGFNGNYLINALQAAQASAGSFKQPAVLEFRSPLSPILLKTNKDDYKIVLPIRLKEEN